MATIERSAGSVEAMRHLLEHLDAERRRLRLEGASEIEVEANLKAIAAIRAHLAQALSQSRAGGVTNGVYRRR